MDRNEFKATVWTAEAAASRCAAMGLAIRRNMDGTAFHGICPKEALEDMALSAQRALGMANEALEMLKAEAILTHALALVRAAKE